MCLCETVASFGGVCGVRTVANVQKRGVCHIQSVVAIGGMCHIRTVAKKKDTAFTRCPNFDKRH